MDIINHHINELDKNLLKIESLKSLNDLLLQQTKQNPNLKDLKFAHVVLVLTAILFLTVLFDCCGGAITNFVGFLYPAYSSIRALQTEETKDDVQWLTYWVVFALLVVIESVFDSLISLLPFYFAIKFFFIIWLFYPTTLGATVVYQSLIKNVSFLRHAPTAKVDVVETVEKKKKEVEDYDSEKDD